MSINRVVSFTANNRTRTVSFSTNGRGPQGVPGEQGEQGGEGATGASGPNQVTNSTATNILGLLKGNGFTVEQATPGTDYQAASANLTSWSLVTRASGFDTFTGTPSSDNLRALLTDETGTGAAVFATSPTLTTPTIAAINGGTAANDDLTLQGTTNATRTTSYVNLQPNGGNVGIGTATPDSQLTIASSSPFISFNTSGSFAGFIFQANGVSRYSVGFQSSQGAEIHTRFNSSGVYQNDPLILDGSGNVSLGGTQQNGFGGAGAAIFAGASGNVGVGTNNPSSKLEVVSASNGTRTDLIRLRNTGSGAGTAAGIGFGYGVTSVSPSWIASPYEDSAGSILVFATGGGGASANADGTERMRISVGGDVGLGTNSPSARMHVVSTTEQLRVGYDASNYYSATVSSAGVVTFNAVGSASSFVFSDTVRLPSFTVGTLPAASTAGAGATAFVTNANATTFASIVASGGSNGVPVYSDGTNWRIG